MNHLLISLVYSLDHKIHFSIINLHLLTDKLSSIFKKNRQYVQKYKPIFKYLYVKQLMEAKPCYSPLQKWNKRKKKQMNKKKERMNEKPVTTKPCASTLLSLCFICYAVTERAIFFLLPFFLPHKSFLNRLVLHHFLRGTRTREPTAVSSASPTPFKVTNFFGSCNVPLEVKVGLVLACRWVGDI